MEEDISEIDNTNAKRVFNHFGITDLEDYHKFYLLTDVLLLADVLENFSDVSLQYYGVDLAHNYTSPGLSQQAALKMMDVELDLFTDIDKHLFIEDVIRGGSGNDQPPTHQQCFYLTHSVREYFEKLALKKVKNATLNGCISSTRRIQSRN